MGYYCRIKILVLDMETITSHQIITGIVSAMLIGFLIGLVVTIIVGRK